MRRSTNTERLSVGFSRLFAGQHCALGRWLSREHVLLQEKTASRVLDHVSEARQLRCSDLEVVGKCVKCWFCSEVRPRQAKCCACENQLCHQAVGDQWGACKRCNMSLQVLRASFCVIRASVDLCRAFLVIPSRSGLSSGPGEGAGQTGLNLMVV